MKKLFSINKKDFEISYFSGTGAGGQHRNKHQNCVRIKHKESGVMCTGQNHKSRKNNLKDALYNLTKKPKFKVWLNRKIYEIVENETIEEKVEKQMDKKNIKIEIKEEGKWNSMK